MTLTSLSFSVPCRPSAPRRAALRAHAISAISALALSAPLSAAHAADDATVEALRQRVDALEAAARKNAAPAPAPRSNAFNPDISLVLSGGYQVRQRDAASWTLPGFLATGEIGPGERGFGLGESELTLSASVDPMFRGALTLAFSDDEGAAVEEAFVQTTALPAGLTLKAGRFLSDIGYQNSQHAHTWAFVDAPLAQQAFLGGQRSEDGLQLRWLAPLPFYTELHAEIGRGGTADSHRAGAWTLGAHVGGDIGTDQSWRAGVSRLAARAQGRESSALTADGEERTDAFTGRSRLWAADAVWKWAPAGSRQRVTLQGEWFWRHERGELSTDTAGAAVADAYDGRHRGGYAQAVWTFAPGWSTGWREERLHTGRVSAGANAEAVAAGSRAPARSSWLLDWQPSEFSRVRLQLAQDRSRADQNDRQVSLQYQMSLGAHGAHGY